MLLCGAPGSGKTTLLRDLIRQLSDRFGWRICVVDERLELAACASGVPQFRLGAHTDVLSGAPKAAGIELLLRTMNPEWIAVDEITAEADIAAIRRASYCGVRFLATAHAADRRELESRPLYRALLQDGFFRMAAFLLPVMASAMAMSGGTVSAGALYAGTALFSGLLSRLIARLLLPGVSVYLVVAAAEAALADSLLSELREFVGWLISKSLRVVLFVFTGYLTVTGVISGSADAAAVRATKAAVSGMVPVVGSILSDASETLLASASALKSSMGVFGMLAVLAICLAPFLKIGAQYLLLKGTAAVSGTIGMPQQVKLVKHAATAMGYLLAMTGACALMLLISVVCFLKVVG